MPIFNSLAENNRTPVFERIAKEPSVCEIVEGRYLVKLALTQMEFESALRLRYEVFKIELAAAARSADTSGEFDFDGFDACCEHLIVIDRITNQTIGIYRISSLELAKKINAFYAFNEFSIEDLPPEIIGQALEIGRACIAREHRNSKVLYHLFKALLKFLKQSNKRYFFGCCSIFTQNYSVGAEIFRQFERQKHIHPTLFVRPRLKCAFSISENAGENCETELKLPALFKIYLKMGVKICGEPTIDRKFKTIDYFVIFDLAAMPDKYRRMFCFDNSECASPGLIKSKPKLNT